MYSYMPTAVGNADCRHVICQPVLWLNGAVVLGCVSRQGESLGESLGPNAVSETCWAGCSLLFLPCFSFQQLDAMPGIVLADLARSEPIADRWSCFRLTRLVIAPAVNNWLFRSPAHNRGIPISSDPALMPRLALLPVLARCIRSLISFRNRPHSSS